MDTSVPIYCENGDCDFEAYEYVERENGSVPLCYTCYRAYQMGFEDEKGDTQ